MSPKQFWQEYGASILGEPDVKRDAKGNLIEVEGKAPKAWLNFESYKQAASVLSSAFDKAIEFTHEKIARGERFAKTTEGERAAL